MPWKISELSFATVDRDLAYANPEGNDLDRPGADGDGWQIHRWRTPLQTITTTTIVAGSEVGNFERKCRLLQGEKATVTDQHAWDWDVAVRTVMLNHTQLPNGTYWIRAVWTLKTKAIRP